MFPSKIQEESVASRGGETDSDPRCNYHVGHRYAQCFFRIHVLMTERDIEDCLSLI